MFTLFAAESPRDTEEIFESFDPQSMTWLVSDLKSKIDLGRRFLTKQNFVPGDAVLRASELWRKLLSRVRPDLQIVSREFTLTLIGQKLAASNIDWVQAPGAAQTTLDYMTQLMPILSHPEGRESVGEWLTAHPESAARWGRWFELSADLWSQFLTDGYLAAPWASGVLVNAGALDDVWSRPLIVDLGPELSSVEADLLVQLSNRVSGLDITVIKPEPSWAGDYPKTLLAYEIFEQKLKVAKRRASSPNVSDAKSQTKNYRKYTTMIAEVKAAVAECRKWLDTGTRPTDIALVAVDIESYWPALASYLEEEGIPCQKDHVRRLHGFPDTARFFANLRLKAGAFAEADLELGVFGPNTDKGSLISYDRFKTLYATLYEREDLDRAETIKARFEADLSLRDEIERDAFVAWSLRQLPGGADIERIEILYKSLFGEIPRSTRLSLKRWLTYLETLAQISEYRIKDGDAGGISFLKLNAAGSSTATKMMILGLTDVSLRKSAGTAILLSDVMSLAQQFGFHLANDDQVRLEFEVRWLTDYSGERELILSVPETDFGGGAQAPAWLWIKGSRESDINKELTVPDATRWDEIQRSDFTAISQNRAWSVDHANLTERTFREDQGEISLDAFAQGAAPTLSPSGIEDYLNCPFIFAAKRLFGLSDSPELDLEVDASRRGTLLHKIFELLTVEPLRFDRSDAELETVVETARDECGLELADKRLWPPLKERHVDLARRFLTFEKTTRLKFPLAKVLDREVEISGFIRPSTGELVADFEPDALKFVGRIDRIDSDDLGNLALYDYKSSASTTTQYGSWCKNNRIQLLLYAIAVENGLTKYPAHPVQSAIYYVARPLSRDNGFKVSDVTQGLYEIEDGRKKNRLKAAEKMKLFNEGHELVKKAVSGISAGRFNPEPHDRKQCPTCQWSAVCRAPHLNF